ncbi:paired-like homeodomain transcription factor LEUTX [Erinaceus europaeus]|uniref:Paired-like homeodomain transcription factor LEUTX n=1 Tax=Erinaceus europaeus TaxID=9365 RepID=A0ABM3VVD5_ERIEU|nr:paired-like homeodomain transcription factor LEUTX [Erinaceus europaeus]
MTSRSRSNPVQSCGNRPTHPIVPARRWRTKFSPEQLYILTKVFEKTKYPDLSKIMVLVIWTKLTKKVIQNWFRNQRVKRRRKQQQNLLRPSDPMLMNSEVEMTEEECGDDDEEEVKEKEEKLMEDKKMEEKEELVEKEGMEEKNKAEEGDLETPESCQLDSADFWDNLLRDSEDFIARCFLSDAAAAEDFSSLYQYLFSENPALLVDTKG